MILEQNDTVITTECMDHMCEISMKEAESMAKLKGDGPLLDRLFHMYTCNSS